MVSSYYGITNVYSYQTTQTHAYGSNHSIYDYNGISYQKYFLHNVDIADSSNNFIHYLLIIF